MGLLSQTISLENFKGCLSQVLLGLFMNTLAHLMKIYKSMKFLVKTVKILP